MLCRFGSHLYGESKDEDVVIISDTVPQQLTEKYDLHVLHPKTLEPIYPETATKTPNLVKLCMKYCSELPEDIKDRIVINKEQLIEEVKKIHVQAVEQYLNIVLSFSGEDLKIKASKPLFKILQSHIILHNPHIIHSNDVRKLFYKSGLVKLNRKGFVHSAWGFIYNSEYKIIEIDCKDAEVDINVDEIYFFELEYLAVKQLFENRVICVNVGNDAVITRTVCMNGEPFTEQRTLKEILVDELDFPSTIEVNGDRTVTFVEEYIGTIWGT